MEIGSRVSSHILVQTSLQHDVLLASGTLALGGRVSAHTGNSPCLSICYESKQDPGSI